MFSNDFVLHYLALSVFHEDEYELDPVQFDLNYVTQWLQSGDKALIKFFCLSKYSVVTINHADRRKSFLINCSWAAYYDSQ